MNQQVKFRTKQETRIAFAGLLEANGDVEEARRIYNHPKKHWYRFHLPMLQKMGLINAKAEPLRSSQSFIYAYTDTPWNEAKQLTEEECRVVAEEFLAGLRIFDFKECL